MTELRVTITTFADHILDILNGPFDTLRSQENLDIRAETYDWGDTLQKLNAIASQQQGPVVSQIGTTWGGSLASQMALRPFSPGEIAAFGGSGAFLPASWRTTHADEDMLTLSIPWLADTYVLYYRRDALQKAGIDEATAFSSLENFSKTLFTLRESGHPMPWASHNGVKTLSMVHNIANWIWGTGSGFLAPDGNIVEFNSHEARRGIRMYFELQKLIPEDARGINDQQASDLYFSGRAAVILSSPNYIHSLNHGAFPPELTNNTGVAVPPGVPFVGGSNWVIWHHIKSTEERLALRFIELMTSKDVLVYLHEKTGILPARIDALSATADDPHYTAAMKTLQTGRSFPLKRLCGLLETRLTEALFHISCELNANPSAELDGLMDRFLSPLERQLNLALSI